MGVFIGKKQQGAIFHIFFHHYLGELLTPVVQYLKTKYNLIFEYLILKRHMLTMYFLKKEQMHSYNMSVNKFVVQETEVKEMLTLFAFRELTYYQCIYQIYVYHYAYTKYMHENMHIFIIQSGVIITELWAILFGSNQVRNNYLEV